MKHDSQGFFYLSGSPPLIRPNLWLQRPVKSCILDRLTDRPMSQYANCMLPSIDKKSRKNRYIWPCETDFRSDVR